MDQMPEMPSMPGMPSERPNLWSILINAAFGFVIGLMIFLGPKEVIAYGTKLAKSLLSLTGSGGQMGVYGFASAAPYIILAPLAGIVVKQLSAVRSIKSFLFFAGAVIVGIIIAYFAKGSLGI
jgi:hypothetical protein